ncbi:hypothetical protein [Catenulispora pinisilvae]|uniref:hypothetical protein n=1 Tax=Catenulispora pinisilvae TaxID=2705253 RepID=UPI001890C47E|nr:hypothetical protein [Catenulispora pinisilvae]
MTGQYAPPSPFLLGDAEAFLGRDSQEPTRQSGVYGWCVGPTRELAVVQYWGEAGNVKARTDYQRARAEEFAEAVANGTDRWTAAGAALTPVLAAHLPDAYPVMWPVDGATERKGYEIALIRMSALHGATPPAQGGGWDWWPQTPAKWAAMSARVRAARRLLNQHFGREPDEFA